MKKNIGAAAFVEYLAGPQGQRIIIDYEAMSVKP